FPPPPVDPTGFPRLREDLQLRRELTSLYEETVSRIPFFSHAMKMDLLQYTLEGLIQVSSGTDYTVHTLQFMQVLIEEAFKVPPL
ncbi:transmembrane protein, partial [Cystoisospora suis]